MKITVQLAGLDALSLVTKKLTAAAQRGLKDGVVEGAALIEQRAKELVPVDTGRLRDAIHTEVMTDEPEIQVLAVAAVVEADNDWGIDPPYARRIEFGFVGVDRLGRHYNQAAQPYMRPAHDEMKDQAIAAIRDSVLSEVDAAMVARR